MEKELREKLLNICKNPFMDKHAIVNNLIDIVYDFHGDDTLKLFMKIQDKKNKEIQEQNLQLMMGVQDGMHNFASLSKHLLEDKNSRKAKDFAKLIIEDETGISFMINIVKTYFPKAEYGAASNLGRWTLNKFVHLVCSNQDSFKSGGTSYSWAKRNNHIDYINLIIENYKQGKYTIE